MIAPDRDQLARFHAGIYLDAFAAQREPLENWLTHDGYEFDARLVLEERSESMGGGNPAGFAGRAGGEATRGEDGDDIIAGITYELYPRSRCGLVTYMVVAPHARERGLGRQLFEYAARDLYARGARAVFGEVNRDAPDRIARFQRWGARVLDYAYVQPALGAGLTRDDGLCLIVMPPAPPVEDGVVREFVEELYAVTEREGISPSRH